MKKIIETPLAPAAVGPYSQAVMAGNFCFVSGQLPIDPVTKKLLNGTIEEQTARVLENITAILDAAGLQRTDVVKVNVYLTNLANFKKMNGVYGTYFDAKCPARAAVQVAALPLGAEIEIEAIAYKNQG
ncbi:MAG: RidA family protein [Candidatus Cloacimonetes bacterium]|nr:RidA family protein [Candidatus Cloacimonadota bacterium]